MPDFSEIAANFEFLPEENDKLEYIIELGKLHATLPESEQTSQNEVHGCQSRVWIASETDANDPERLRIDGTSDSVIVRGLVALAVILFDGRRRTEIVDLDAETIFVELGLKSYLTSRRASGLRSVIARIKSDAREALAA